MIIEILRFDFGKTIITSITKDTPNLKKHGVSLHKIVPVMCKDGLALQKCDARLYALIHIRSGHTIQMRSMSPSIAEEWFSGACAIMEWNGSVEDVVKDVRVKAVLELGKQLEDKYMFPDEYEKVENVSHIELWCYRCNYGVTLIGRDAIELFMKYGRDKDKPSCKGCEKHFKFTIHLHKREDEKIVEEVKVEVEQMALTGF